MDLDEMTIEEIWETIDEKANEKPELIEGMNTIYSFDLTGDDGGHYNLKIADGKVETSTGEIEDVDCSLKMSVKNFKKLIQGNLNSTTAFMTGRLKVKGNIGLALKLENLLKKYEF